MKKRLAQWFLLVAKRFDPAITVENYKHVVDYEPKRLGLSVEIKKQDVRKFREGSSFTFPEAEKAIVADTKKQIRAYIMDSIDRMGLIDMEVRKKGSGFIVTGDLKVNVPCPSEDRK